MNPNQRVAYLSVGLPLASVLILGFVSGNVWTCLLTLTGLLTVNKGLYQPVPGKKQQLLLRAVAGLALVGAGTWLGRLEAPWIWTFIWVLTAFYLLAAAARMHMQSPQWRVALVGAATVLSLVLAVLIPLASYGQLTRASIPLLLLILIIVFGGVTSYSLAASKGVTDKRFLAVVSSLLLAVAVVVAYATRNIPSGLLTLAGILLLFKDMRRLAQGALHKYRRIFAWSLIGLLLVGAATWLDGMRGGWIWAPIWLLAAVALAFKATPILNRKKKDRFDARGMTGTGVAAFVAAALCLLFAAAGPSILVELSVSKAVLTFLLLALGLASVAGALLITGFARPMYFIVFGFLGTVLIAAAAFYSQVAGRWAWTPFWLLAALLTFRDGRSLLRVAKPAGAYGIALALLNALLAVTGPLFGASYVEEVNSLLHRPQGETLTRFLAAGTIPALLLVLGVVGAFLIVRARRAPSSTATLESLLGMLSTVGGGKQQPGKGPSPRPPQAKRTIPELDSARALLSALDRAKQLTTKGSTPPSPQAKASAPELDSLLALLSAFDRVKQQPKKK